MDQVKPAFSGQMDAGWDLLVKLGTPRTAGVGHNTQVQWPGSDWDLQVLWRAQKQWLLRFLCSGMGRKSKHFLHICMYVCVWE